MVTFKQFLLLEGKVHQVEIFQNAPPIQVFQNPNKEQMKTLHGNSRKFIRTIKDGDDHYAWDGDAAIHRQVGSSLHISDKDRGFFDKLRVQQCGFDLPRCHNKYGMVSLAKQRKEWDNIDDDNDSTGIDTLMKRFKEQQ